MKITALDIHQKEFAHGMRGYREEEVDAFLDQLAVEVDAADKRSKELEEKVAMLESRDAALAAERNTINNTLLTAQRAADAMLKKAQAECADTLEAAQRQSEAQLASARQQADRIVEEARQKRHQVVGSFARLQGEEEKFRNGYLAQLESFLAGVRQLETDAHAVVEEIAVPQDLKEELYTAQRETARAAQAAEVKKATAAKKAAASMPPAPASVAPPVPQPQPQPQPQPVRLVNKVVPEPVIDEGEAEGPLADALADSDFFDAAEKPSFEGVDEPTLQQAPVMPASAPEPISAPAPVASMPAPAPGKAPASSPTIQWGDLDDDLDIETID